MSEKKGVLKKGGFADSFIKYEKEIEQRGYQKAIDDIIEICTEEMEFLSKAINDIRQIDDKEENDAIYCTLSRVRGTIKQLKEK